MEKINKGIILPILMALAMCMVFTGLSSAQTVFTYTVDASTYPVDNTVDATNPVAAQISNNAAIEQIWISASSTSTAQTVSIYQNCTSTTAISLVWRGYIPVGVTNIPAFNLQYPLAPAKFYITNACFRKSDTASSVQFNVSYQ